MNVPVLARELEKRGVSTVLITPMPYWAERIGTPRTLAVEHPFGRTIGPPNDSELQFAVVQAAVEVLETAQRAGAIVHYASQWPEDVAETIKAWQPQEPSPVIKALGPELRRLLRRRKAS